MPGTTPGVQKACKIIISKTPLKTSSARSQSLLE